jgi:tetratricopeptide (TPR) repeat protein
MAYRVSKLVAIAAGIAVAPGLAAAEPPGTQPAGQDDASYCAAAVGGVRASAPSTPVDYRLRTSDDRVNWQYKDNWQYHMGPALERMRAGEYSRFVMGNLDWTLRRWPNHLEALRGLIDYSQHGGRTYEFLPARCYFVLARATFPDDENVRLAEALFLWKSGDFQSAIAAYEGAIAAEPNSADAYYNLGLLYLDRKQYELAVGNARKAYALGYPLPGLRKKLQESGHWSDR